MTRWKMRKKVHFFDVHDIFLVCKIPAKVIEQKKQKNRLFF